jgi:hypothetical protein
MLMKEQVREFQSDDIKIIKKSLAGTQTQVRPLPQAPTPNLAKIAPAHPVNCHKK